METHLDTGSDGIGKVDAPSTSISDGRSAPQNCVLINHTLVDGNKRLGWLAAVVMLDVNGYVVRLGDDDAFGLVMGVAEGRLDVDEIAERLGLE